MYRRHLDGRGVLGCSLGSLYKCISDASLKKTFFNLIDVAELDYTRKLDVFLNQVNCTSLYIHCNRSSET